MNATENRTTHTPGPLMQYGHMVADTPTTVGGMYAIQEAIRTPRGSWVGKGRCIGYACSQADAQLWATAPELLTALRRLLDEADDDGITTDGVEQALIAITKATVI